LYASRFETDQDDEVDVWSSDCVCSDCGEESYGNCDDCDCCEGCCVCKDYDDEEEEEPNTEVQLTLNLDNKMQSIDWTKQTVNLIKLVGHLFSSRRPALAMSLRREFDNYDDTTRVAYEVLLHHTTESDAKALYNELNP
jgi:hypothetical protein